MAEEKAGKSKKSGEEKAAEPAPVSAPAAPVPAAPVPAPAEDRQLVAVITAAVAAAMGTSSDGFVVRSIRRRSGNKWKKS